MYEPGRKLTGDCVFGILTIPHRTRGGLSGRNIDLAPGWFITSELPVDLPSDIATRVGTLALPDITGAASYLVIRYESGPTPGWVARLSEELARAQLALLIAAPFFSHSTPFCIVGSLDAGRLTFPRIFDLFGTRYSAGRPDGSVTEEQLREIPRIADAIRICDGYERIGRMVRTFRRACQEADSEVRLHQFVRTCEGFIARYGSGPFCAGIQEIVVSSDVDQLKKLYNVRSQVEHMSGAFAALRGPPNYKEWRVDWHLVRAEAIARHILRTIFLEPALWPHFASNSTLGRFWSDNYRAERRAVIGPKFKLDSVTDKWEKQKPPPPPSAEEMARFANPDD